MSDALKVLIPSLVGVIPAVLLYLQNKSSSQRESDDRQLERKADDKRREQELEAKKLDIEQSRDAETIRAQEADRQRERDRYLRFMVAAQDVALYWKAQESAGARKLLTGDLRAELASAYEDALLSAPDEVQSAMTDVKDGLDKFARGAINPLYETLQGDMNYLRDAIREHLS